MLMVTFTILKDQHLKNITPSHHGQSISMLKIHMNKLMYDAKIKFVG